MTALPAKAAFTDAAVTEANFKAAVEDLRDYLAGLLGDSGDVADALAMLGLGALPGLLNGKVVMSVASNALTVSIKDLDGNDPSAGNPVYATFPSTTPNDASLTRIAITSALSVVVPDTATLGHASAVACHLFAYLIDNSGTVELAVSNLPPDYPGVFGNTRLISTTTVGTGSDSATGIYSTAGRSNVPWVCVAMAKSTQATAGTWAAAMTQVDQAPFSIPGCEFTTYMSAPVSTAFNTFTKMAFNQERYDPYGVYDAATNYRHQPNVAGVYRYSHRNTYNASTAARLDVALYLNGVLHSNATVFAGAAEFPNLPADAEIMMNGTTDYVEAFARQTDSNPLDIGSASSTQTEFRGGRVPQ